MPASAACATESGPDDIVMYRPSAMMELIPAVMRTGVHPRGPPPLRVPHVVAEREHQGSGNAERDELHARHRQRAEAVRDRRHDGGDEHRIRPEEALGAVLERDAGPGGGDERDHDVA